MLLSFLIHFSQIYSKAVPKRQSFDYQQLTKTLRFQTVRFRTFFVRCRTISEYRQIASKTFKL